MRLKVKNKDTLLDWLTALSYIKADGYELNITNMFSTTAVLAKDDSLNAILNTFSLALDSAETTERRIRLNTMSVFKKFIKYVDSDVPIIELDENINTLLYGEHSFSLNSKEFRRGFFQSNKPAGELGEHAIYQVSDIRALVDAITSDKPGDIMNIRNGKLTMGTWDMDMVRIDAGEFAPQPVNIYRESLKSIAKIHKKIGNDLMKIRIYSDKMYPAIICQGKSPVYKAYCAVIQEDFLKQNEVKK